MKDRTTEALNMYGICLFVLALCFVISTYVLSWRISSLEDDRSSLRGRSGQ